ncbi:hypothetical protein DIPPA_16503 [Diplonema papillatum]|nr:hypothetical protein DIPPA_16503 [Diplonema papillatum]
MNKLREDLFDSKEQVSLLEAKAARREVLLKEYQQTLADMEAQRNVSLQKIDEYVFSLAEHRGRVNDLEKEVAQLVDGRNADAEKLGALQDEIARVVQDNDELRAELEAAADAAEFGADALPEETPVHGDRIDQQADDDYEEEYLEEDVHPVYRRPDWSGGEHSDAEEDPDGAARGRRRLVLEEHAQSYVIERQLSRQGSSPRRFDVVDTSRLEPRPEVVSVVKKPKRKKHPDSASSVHSERRVTIAQGEDDAEETEFEEEEEEGQLNSYQFPDLLPELEVSHRGLQGPPTLFERRRASKTGTSSPLPVPPSPLASAIQRSNAVLSASLDKAPSPIVRRGESQQDLMNSYHRALERTSSGRAGGRSTEPLTPVRRMVSGGVQTSLTPRASPRGGGTPLQRAQSEQALSRQGSRLSAKSKQNESIQPRTLSPFFRETSTRSFLSRQSSGISQSTGPAQEPRTLTPLPKGGARKALARDLSSSRLSAGAPQRTLSPLTRTVSGQPGTPQHQIRTLTPLVRNYSGSPRQALSRQGSAQSPLEAHRTLSARGTQFVDSPVAARKTLSMVGSPRAQEYPAGRTLSRQASNHSADFSAGSPGMQSPRGQYPTGRTLSRQGSRGQEYQGGGSPRSQDHSPRSPREQNYLAGRTLSRQGSRGHDYGGGRTLSRQGSSRSASAGPARAERPLRTLSRQGSVRSNSARAPLVRTLSGGPGTPVSVYQQPQHRTLSRQHSLRSFRDDDESSGSPVVRTMSELAQPTRQPRTLSRQGSTSFAEDRHLIIPLYATLSDRHRSHRLSRASSARSLSPKRVATQQHRTLSRQASSQSMHSPGARQLSRHGSGRSLSPGYLAATPKRSDTQLKAEMLRTLGGDGSPGSVEREIGGVGFGARASPRAEALSPAGRKPADWRPIPPGLEGYATSYFLPRADSPLPTSPHNVLNDSVGGRSDVVYGLPPVVRQTSTKAVSPRTPLRGGEQRTFGTQMTRSLSASSVARRLHPDSPGNMQSRTCSPMSPYLERQQQQQSTFGRPPSPRHEPKQRDPLSTPEPLRFDRTSSARSDISTLTADRSTSRRRSPQGRQAIDMSTSPLVPPSPEARVELFGLHGPTITLEREQSVQRGEIATSPMVYPRKTTVPVFSMDDDMQSVRSMGSTQSIRSGRSGKSTRSARAAKSPDEIRRRAEKAAADMLRTLSPGLRPAEPQLPRTLSYRREPSFPNRTLTPRMNPAHVPRTLSPGLSPRDNGMQRTMSELISPELLVRSLSSKSMAGSEARTPRNVDRSIYDDMRRSFEDELDERERQLQESLYALEVRERDVVEYADRLSCAEEELAATEAQLAEMEHRFNEAEHRATQAEEQLVAADDETRARHAEMEEKWAEVAQEREELLRGKEALHLASVAVASEIFLRPEDISEALPDDAVVAALHSSVACVNGLRSLIDQGTSSLSAAMATATDQLSQALVAQRNRVEVACAAVRNLQQGLLDQKRKHAQRKAESDKQISSLQSCIADMETELAEEHEKNLRLQDDKLKLEFEVQKLSTELRSLDSNCEKLRKDNLRCRADLSVSLDQVAGLERATSQLRVEKEKAVDESLQRSQYMEKQKAEFSELIKKAARADECLAGGLDTKLKILHETLTAGLGGLKDYFEQCGWWGTEALGLSKVFLSSVTTCTGRCEQILDEVLSLARKATANSPRVGSQVRTSRRSVSPHRGLVISPRRHRDDSVRGCLHTSLARHECQTVEAMTSRLQSLSAALHQHSQQRDSSMKAVLQRLVTFEQSMTSQLSTLHAIVSNTPSSPPKTNGRSGTRIPESGSQFFTAANTPMRLLQFRVSEQMNEGQRIDGRHDSYMSMPNLTPIGKAGGSRGALSPVHRHIESLCSITTTTRSEQR